MLPVVTARPLTVMLHWLEAGAKSMLKYWLVLQAEASSTVLYEPELLDFTEYTTSVSGVTVSGVSKEL